VDGPGSEAVAPGAEMEDERETGTVEDFEFIGDRCI
jgi:hypothetical protein